MKLKNMPWSFTETKPLEHKTRSATYHFMNVLILKNTYRENTGTNASFMDGDMADIPIFYFYFYYEISVEM